MLGLPEGPRVSTVRAASVCSHVAMVHCKSPSYGAPHLRWTSVVHSWLSSVLLPPSARARAELQPDSRCPAVHTERSAPRRGRGGACMDELRRGFPACARSRQRGVRALALPSARAPASGLAPRGGQRRGRRKSARGKRLSEGDGKRALPARRTAWRLAACAPHARIACTPHHCMATRRRRAGFALGARGGKRPSRCPRRTQARARGRARGLRGLVGEPRPPARAWGLVGEPRPPARAFATRDTRWPRSGTPPPSMHSARIPRGTSAGGPSRKRRQSPTCPRGNCRTRSLAACAPHARIARTPHHCVAAVLRTACTPHSSRAGGADARAS